MRVQRRRHAHALALAEKSNDRQVNIENAAARRRSRLKEAFFGLLPIAEFSNWYNRRTALQEVAIRRKMSCGSEYMPLLRERGFRVTSQRMAILHVLHHAGTHMSPTQVFRMASKDLPGLTEPTVYRTLEFLAENGIVQASYTRRGHSTYQIAGEQHHHLVCRVCGGEIEIDHHLLERLYRSLESSSGFRRIDSHLTFMGVCPRCQKKAGSE